MAGSAIAFARPAEPTCPLGPMWVPQECQSAGSLRPDARNRLYLAGWSLSWQLSTRDRKLHRAAIPALSGSPGSQQSVRRDAGCPRCRSWPAATSRRGEQKDEWTNEGNEGEGDLRPDVLTRSFQRDRKNCNDAEDPW